MWTGIKNSAEEFKGSVAVVATFILLTLLLLLCIPLPKVQAPTQPKGPVACCSAKACEVQHHHGS